MTLLTYRSEHRLSWQEHVTAANWALPGLVGFWLLLRWAVGLYRCDGVRKIPGAPFLGPHA